MPRDAGAFGDLMRQVCEGSQEAAETLLAEYGPYIRQVVRRKLAGWLRTEFDSLDFVQDVWASFFAQPRSADAFTKPAALIGFLAGIARHKVVNAYRRRLPDGQHGLRRSLNGLASAEQEPTSRDPTPSQVAVEKEQWRRLCLGRSELHRRILELLRQGATHAEIGQELGVNVKTVQRLVRRLEVKRMS